MIAVPAIDLKGGRCVQLVGGRPDAERVSLPDPVSVAEQWWRVGFRTLHVVDLDAALGTGENTDAVRSLLDATPARTQVGGGVRDDARAEALLAAGADRIVVGTRALDDHDWLLAMTEWVPDRVVVAVDTREGYVLRKGWTEQSRLTLSDFLERIEGLRLAGVLATDVGREGRLEGLDRASVSLTMKWSTHPTWIAGGVTTEDDLTWLEEEGAAGAVLGMALYAGDLDAEAVAARWGGSGTDEDADDGTGREPDIDNDGNTQAKEGTDR